ncbi:hypothetical protein SSIG_07373 [Streptomyces filamentosus NRRL 11379]|nr:hypothetical protein SSIG_07373 [Streptomyces filamentosus NRRL 11379]
MNGRDWWGDGTFQHSPSLATKHSALVCSGNLLLHRERYVRVEALHAGDLATLPPGARHVALKGRGDSPMSDDPDQVAQVVLDAIGG